MTRISAFEYPPGSGNAVALVAYYSVYLAAQIGLGLKFLRRWNWPIFLQLTLCLVLQILGSVAYLKLHFKPFTGAWYNLWIVSLTAGPIFFISSLHACVELALRQTTPATVLPHVVRVSRRQYLATCYTIDILALVITIIGGIYASAKSSNSSTAFQPGFDIMVAAMALQLCSLIFTMAVGLNVIVSITKLLRKPAPNATVMQTAIPDASEKPSLDKAILRRPRLLLTHLCVVLFTALLLFAWTIVRAADLAGGIEGPLRLPVLSNVEHILVFVAIFFFTPLHPAIILRYSGRVEPWEQGQVSTPLPE